jgi:hypothetical protein
LGEYLRGNGQRLVLAGKTHVMPDVDGLARLQIDGGSVSSTRPSTTRSRRLICANASPSSGWSPPAARLAIWRRS